MARIGPALDVIAAATTPDERARCGALEEQPRGRGGRLQFGVNKYSCVGFGDQHRGIVVLLK